jgi:hypothetical protein
MTEQRPDDRQPGTQRFIVSASRGAPGALGTALARLEREPAVRVDQVHGSRTDPRRLVITAPQEVVDRLMQEFKGAIACERDRELKLDDSHGYASKTTDVPRGDGPVQEPK